MSSSTSPLRGIIFDMDGVLCDSEPFICAAAIQMFQETYDQRVVKEDFAPFVGAGEDRFIGGVAEKYGVKLTMPRDKLRTYAIYLEIIKGCLKPLPGAVDFIRDARERGLRTAVATSADRIKMDGNLREIGVSPAEFQALITGDDVERKKPDPQIFLLAANRIDVQPAECLVVEDAVNGVRAAKAAGCRCLALTTSFSAQTLRDAGADFIAVDLATCPLRCWKTHKCTGTIDKPIFGRSNPNQHAANRPAFSPTSPGPSRPRETSRLIVGNAA